MSEFAGHSRIKVPAGYQPQVLQMLQSFSNTALIFREFLCLISIRYRSRFTQRKKKAGVSLMLSSREVSLSDHVKRRRSTPAVAATGGGGGNNTSSGGRSSAASRSSSSSSSSSSPSSPSSSRGSSGSVEEGGFDAHAASYGNCDAPGVHCRGGYHHASADHGCYAAEASIYPAGRAGTSSGRGDGRIRPSRFGSCSSPMSDLDLQRCEENGGVGNNYSCSDRGLPPPLSSRGGSHPAPRRGGAWDPALRHIMVNRAGAAAAHTVDIREDDGSTTTVMHPPPNCDPRKADRPSSSSSSHSCCPSIATASTASSGGSSSGGSNFSIAPSAILEEEDIRQGIIDISSLVATYLAGALAFVIGIFLTLLSPFVRAVRLIAGDVRGLLGDLGILHELGGLWRLWRNLRRRSGGAGGRRRWDHPAGGGDHLYDRDVACRYQDDESANTDNSTVHTDQSPHFVAGWTPTLCPSVGSSGVGSTANSAACTSWRGEEGESSSRSYHSLPMYHQDPYQQGCHPNHHPAPDVSSCPPVVQMNFRHAGRPSSLYGVGGSGAYARHSNNIAITPSTSECSQYYDDVPSYSKATSRSPTKPSRSASAGGNHHHGVTYRRSRSDVV